MFRVNAFCTDLEGIATMFGSKADGYGVELFNNDLLRISDPRESVIELNAQAQALAANLMLLLTYQPQMLTEDPGGSGKPLGFQTARERKNRMLPVSWLGKDFKPQPVSPAVTPPAPMPAHKLIGAAAIGTPSPLAKGGSSDDWIGSHRSVNAEISEAA